MTIDIVLEVCGDCASHQWNTRHDEATYNKYKDDVIAKLKELIPGCNILTNRVPTAWAEHDPYCQLIVNEAYNHYSEAAIQPRLGAFEVSTVHKGTAITFFSKLMSRMWPEPTAMTNRIKQFLEDAERSEMD